MSNASRRDALVKAAKELGVNPLDLATIIGFESGGTYNPGKWGGQDGKYLGLIQFGPAEQKKYGVHPGQSFEDQLANSVVPFLKDRFKAVGMDTHGATQEDIYTCILTGNPKGNRNAKDSNGTNVLNAMDKMKAHRTVAANLFGLDKTGVEPLKDVANITTDMIKPVDNSAKTPLIKKTENDKARTPNFFQSMFASRAEENESKINDVTKNAAKLGLPADKLFAMNTAAINGEVHASFKDKLAYEGVMAAQYNGALHAEGRKGIKVDGYFKHNTFAASVMLHNDMKADAHHTKTASYPFARHEGR